MSIRIIVADDHGILRAGLIALLNAEPDIEVVGEAASAEEVIQKTSELKPDVILMDVSMPGMNGIEATRQIRRQFPRTAVLVLTVHGDKAVLQDALKAGAMGYIVKKSAKAELLEAIRAVGKGELYVQPSLTRALVTGMVDERRNRLQGLDHEKLLTKREKEILRLIAQGYTNHQMAEKLNISTRTVEFHRANIVLKLGVKSRMELVRCAVDMGLLQ